MSNEEKKIIIDEDWKSQVEAEKAATEQAESEPAASESSEPGGGAFDDDPQMPPASFEMLLTTLATEAMLAMGQMPHPVTGEATVRKNQAQYLIDTIAMLKEKTKDNLQPAESGALDTLLHQLRMAFIAVNH